MRLIALFLFFSLFKFDPLCATDHVETATVEPEAALHYLEHGNVRFTHPKNLRRDGQGPADIERLSTGQHPHSMVLSCADSRVPPEIVFDQKLGEIFVVRAAGEALDSSVIASLEYAAEHLGSRLLVVMGHTECGAVKAALSTKPGTSAGSENLDKLVADIRPRITTGKAETSASPHFEVEAIANAKGVAHQLLERSSILKHLVDAGKLKIVFSIYHLDSGVVEFHD